MERTQEMIRKYTASTCYHAFNLSVHTKRDLVDIALSCKVPPAHIKDAIAAGKWYSQVGEYIRDL